MKDFGSNKSQPECGKGLLARREIDRMITTPARGERLSSRERTVLRLIADGCTNAEIAAELNLAKDTVRDYTVRVYRKLNAKNRPHAVTRGYQEGYLDSDDE